MVSLALESMKVGTFAILKFWKPLLISAAGTSSITTPDRPGLSVTRAERTKFWIWLGAVLTVAAFAEEGMAGLVPVVGETMLALAL